MMPVPVRAKMRQCEIWRVQIPARLCRGAANCHVHPLLTCPWGGCFSPQLVPKYLGVVSLRYELITSFIAVSSMFPASAYSSVSILLQASANDDVPTVLGPSGDHVLEAIAVDEIISRRKPLGRYAQPRPLSRDLSPCMGTTTPWKRGSSAAVYTFVARTTSLATTVLRGVVTCQVPSAALATDVAACWRVSEDP